jgi:hypothetical protein
MLGLISGLLGVAVLAGFLIRFIAFLLDWEAGESWEHGSEWMPISDVAKRQSHGIVSFLTFRRELFL